MNRTMIAALAVLLFAGGILTMVVVATNNRSTSQQTPTPDKDQYDHGDWKSKKWTDEFTLTERSGKLFHSRDLQGQVWVTSFFFASCPKECVEQNEMVAALHNEFAKQGVTFVSITVDPQTDSPAKLREYAHRFTSDDKGWQFLTGELEHIRRIGGEMFEFPVERGIHSSKLAIVDKWGEVRGSFNWKVPEELAQFRVALKEILTETSPPPKPEVSMKTIKYDHGDWRKEDPVENFTLTQRSGEKFHSRDMAGKIWIVSFFFTKCPSICRQQNNHVEAFVKQYGPRGVTFVSITCDPETDDPAKLREYAVMYDADPDQWLFLTGELPHIRLIGQEVFNVAVEKETHSERLILVDRKGEVRGHYSWSESGQLDKLKKQLEELLASKPAPDDLPTSSASAARH